MSTNNLDESNPIAFMLVVGAGSILGGILSQVLFPREECPVPEKSTEDTQNKSEESNLKQTEEPINESIKPETTMEMS